MSRISRIGVSGCFFHSDPERAIFKGKTLIYAEESMLDYLHAAGAMAYMIPRTGLQKDCQIKLSQYVEQLDGLLLQGGSDVSPKSYGEEGIQNNQWPGDYPRDQYEIELVKAFVAAKKPVLGICRGAQLINVALGGTLYQDLQTQRPELQVHRNWDIYDQLFHEIQLVEDRPLAAIYKTNGAVKVNSVHHQAIKDLAFGLSPDAFSIEPKIGVSDLIEAFSESDSSQGYIRAVQWHPEFQDREDDSLFDPMPLLDDFIRVSLGSN